MTREKDSYEKRRESLIRKSYTSAYKKSIEPSLIEKLNKLKEDDKKEKIKERIDKANKLGRAESQAKLKEDLLKSKKRKKNIAKAGKFGDRLQSFGSSFAKKKFLGKAHAKVPSINALQAITPTEHISVVRSAEQVQPRTFEEPRSLFFKEEFAREQKSSRSFIWFLTLTFHVPQLFVLGGEL